MRETASHVRNFSGTSKRDTGMNKGMVYLRPFRLVYARVTGPYESSIPAAWDKMLGWLSKNGLHSPIGRGFGLARDNPAAVGMDKCRYDACVELDPYMEERAMRELAVQTMPGGSYVRQRQSGDYASITSVVSGLHQSFEAPPGLRFDDKRPLVTMYLDDPRKFEQEQLRADICLPVSAKTGRGRDEDDQAAA